MPFFHSTRLFPKGMGADRYQISGIAARCDWVFLSDSKPPHTHLFHNVATDEPRHIFLSLRDESHAIPAFVETVLPRLTKPFVLVSGSEDVTLPRQTDARRQPFSDTMVGHIAEILDHPLLLRWFAENLDDASDPRFTALPVGMVYHDGEHQQVSEVADRQPMSARPCRALCGHRVREGRQWDLRRHVSELAQTVWSPFCDVLTAEVPEPEFLRLAASHAFVVCVEGGGLDPSPKAWQSILHGVIPIIRRSPTSQAYSDLPVAFVDAWEADALSATKLAEWQAHLGPQFDDPDQRREVLRRLGSDYWWDKVTGHGRP